MAALVYHAVDSGRPKSVSRRLQSSRRVGTALVKAGDRVLIQNMQLIFTKVKVLGAVWIGTNFHLCNFGNLNLGKRLGIGSFSGLWK